MAKHFIQYFEDSFKENWDMKSMYNYATKQSITYGELADKVAKMHLLFKAFDIKQDDKIAIVGPNSQEWAITFISVITYGAVVVPIQEDFHPDVIEVIINHSETRLLFIS
ncbi:MAG: AMP-binding protein, partial [Paludibacteraceae bacterium]|nr:AMP-binding protein [Paludibacteraceae bacterium]